MDPDPSGAGGVCNPWSQESRESRKRLLLLDVDLANSYDAIHDSRFTHPYQIAMPAPALPTDRDHRRVFHRRSTNHVDIHGSIRTDNWVFLVKKKKNMCSYLLTAFALLS